jgi:hypothetical protein
MPWIRHQDEHGLDSQVQRKQSHIHKIAGGKGRNNKETKEKSSVIDVKNPDI